MRHSEKGSVGLDCIYKLKINSWYVENYSDVTYRLQLQSDLIHLLGSLAYGSSKHYVPRFMVTVFSKCDIIHSLYHAKKT